MNKIKKGYLFEKEAYIILKSIFDNVTWNSENMKKATYDFKCIKNGKEYNVEAKTRNSKKPTIRKSQENADYIIFKNNDDIISLIENKDFIKKVYMEKTPNPRLYVLREDKDYFDKLRLDWNMKYPNMRKTNEEFFRMIVNVFKENNRI